MVEKERLKPGAIVSGAGLPEPVRLTHADEEAGLIRLRGVGVKTRKNHERILDAAGLATLVVASNNTMQTTVSPSQFVYYYLSELLGCPVRREGESKPFGRLHDLGAGSQSPYPLVVVLAVKSRKSGITHVPWSAVLEFTPQEIVVRPNGTAASGDVGDKADFWLRRHVLDNQVVDISGAKVVRVNDIHMLYAEGQLVVGHVDVGVLGILRRLNLEKAVTRLLRWLLDYTIKEEFVTWRHVQVIAPQGSPAGVRVSAGPSRLADIRPAELADILEELGVRERQAVLSALPVETAAETLEELDPEVQRSVIAEQEPSKAADLLEEMPAKEAAAVLRDVGPADAESIISRMNREAAQDVMVILSHPEMTAGGVMATSCIEVQPYETAAAVLERVRALADEVEVFNHIYVLDSERHLVGVLNLRELLRAKPDTTMESLMTRDLVKVLPDTSLQDVARLLMKYGFRAIPVVDKNNVFLGAVRMKSVVDELLPLPRD